MGSRSALPSRLVIDGCSACTASPAAAPREVTKLFLGSRHVPFRFVDVAAAPDKRLKLQKKLGSSSSSVILEKGEHLTVTQGVSVARLSHDLTKYKTRHPG